MKLDPIEQAILVWAENQNEGTDPRRHDVFQLVSNRAPFIAQAVRAALTNLPTETDYMALVDLTMRLREAASREGKSRGDHMAAVFHMLAQHGKDSEDRSERDIAEVNDGAAHAIRAETAMVTELQTVAVDAAVTIERLCGSLV